MRTRALEQVICSAQVPPL